MKISNHYLEGIQLQLIGKKAVREEKLLEKIRQTH